MNREMAGACSYVFGVRRRRDSTRESSRHPSRPDSGQVSATVLCLRSASASFLASVYDARRDVYVNTHIYSYIGAMPRIRITPPGSRVAQ